jgi:non-canonical poly(A) RNA polymerase PAPD5/7
VDFYDHIRPQDFEERIRGQLVEQLKNLCRANFRDAEVYPFGSFPSGLYLPTGDIDLVLCSDSVMDGGRARYTNKSALYAFKSMLINSGLANHNDIELIIGARVPLVKFIDSRTGLKVDVSFENLTGINAINTFLAWKKQYPAMPVLVTLVKHFLAMRGLNEPVNGGIGGFSVICLVVSMLQQMPDIQSRSKNGEHYYGDLLMAFFDLYGNKFNYHTTAISLNPPAYIPKVSVPVPPHVGCFTLLTMLPFSESRRGLYIQERRPLVDY